MKQTESNIGKVVMTLTVQIKPEIEIGLLTAIKLRILGGRRALAQILNKLRSEMVR